MPETLTSGRPPDRRIGADAREVPISSLECRSLRNEDRAAFLTFARDMWGRHSPQARPGFLRWALDHNPHGRPSAVDFFIALADGRVVASHRRMRVPWRVEGEARVGVSLYDLAALPEHRQGVGAQLVLRAIAGESIVLAAGLSPDAQRLYERLRAPKIRLYGLQRVLSPPRWLSQRVRSELGTGFGAPPRVAEDLRVRGVQLQITSHPDDRTLSAAAALPAPDPGPAWDAPGLRWRFFHPEGPRAVLVQARVDGALAARAVVSVGLRQQARVARVVDAVVPDPKLWPALSAGIDRAARRSHASVALLATSDPVAADALRAQGWSPRPEDPVAAAFFRGVAVDPARLRLWGGAWDLGVDPPDQARGR